MRLSNGPEAGRDGPRHLARGLAVWLLIAFAEVVHGTVRSLWLVPVVGDLASRQIGVFTGSLIILAIAWATIGWIGARRSSAQLRVGLMWVVLMVAFEVSFGRLVGLSWERIASDYLPWQGGLMPIGLLALLFAPWIAARLRARRPGRA